MQMANNQTPLSSLSGKKTIDEKLLLPYHHLTATPGQKSRSLMGLALNYWLDIPESKLDMINEIVDNLYNCGLLIDDIQDNAEVRRGMPVAHKVNGVPATLMAASYSCSIALEKCLLLEHPEAMKICTRHLLTAFKGIGFDCYWRDNLTCPTLEEFLRLSDATPSMFSMCLDLMQLFSKNKQDFSKLVKLLGKYYQIRNDYFDLWSEKYMRHRKSYCEDITDGKFSFPITYAVNNSPKSEEIMKILKLRTKDDEVKKYCLSLIEECGTKEYTRNKLEDLLGQAFDEVRKFGGNPILEKYIDSITVTDES